jgi:hypothetical protein
MGVLDDGFGDGFGDILQIVEPKGHLKDRAKLFEHQIHITLQTIEINQGPQA